MYLVFLSIFKIIARVIKTRKVRRERDMKNSEKGWKRVERREEKKKCMIIYFISLNTNEIGVLKNCHGN